jgi:putative ABC transport system permease protein
LIVAGQVALAVVMIIGATLLLKTFLNLGETQPGFRPQHVLTMQITLSPNEYAEPAQQAAFWRRVLRETEALPGVRSAGVVSVLPTTGSHSNTDRTPIIWVGGIMGVLISA